MTKGQIYIVTCLVFALLTGCKDEENAVVSPVTADLAFSVSSSAQSTRMAATVVQENGNYRYMQDLRIVPFAVTERKIVADDSPWWKDLSDTEQRYEREGAWFYYFQHCQFTPGVGSFLVYGRAVPTYGTATPTIADKGINGSLDAVFPATMRPKEISFSPTGICSTTDADPKATALAAYLTAIANTSFMWESTNRTWQGVSSSGLKALYQNFIGQKNVATVDMAGSSLNVKKHVNELYTQVDGLKVSYTEGSLERGMCEAILDKIATYTGVTFNTTEKEVTSLGTSMENFPACIGLPDGAAVVRWTGSQFEPQTQTTTMDNITDITRYAYPAELYYYANSLIRTSNIDNRASVYSGTSAATTWEEVLDAYEFTHGVVSRRTTAVVIEDPLQYGVAHLQVKLKKVADHLVDAAGTDIPVGATSFPLTGILVGRQYPVGFDFKPMDTSDAYFIYDARVKKGDNTELCLSTTVEESEATHTLVLQSKDADEVPVVLEFRNDSGYTFEGVGGIIYPDTKFYLVAKVKAETVAEGDDDYKKRVFTQDRKTTMGMKVVSLAKAYNVLPNLLSPRLEIGVEVITKWMQAETTNVMLD